MPVSLFNRLPPQPTDPLPAFAPDTFDAFARRVMSGGDRRPAAILLRAALAAAEPAYAAAASGRNWLFDAGIRGPRRLPRPAVSVGNVTTGGTGKTPVIRWLARRLRDEGHRVAILSRGYKAKAGSLGDEQVMLDRALNSPTEAHRVTVVANPDRLTGAREALRLRPDTDVFLLDDAFQHRRAARDMDVVLISATCPFGYGHVLPRGMLREPLRGLQRAGAFVITHADQVDDAGRSAIEQTIRRYNARAPVYHAVHALAALRNADAATASPPDRSPGDLRGRSWFAFCGIGDPQTFLRQLQAVGGRHAGHRWFADHHAYTEDDLRALRRSAAASGADVLVTTEKDWAKLSNLPAATAANAGAPVWRVDVEIQFREDGDERLLEQVRAAITPAAG